MLTPGNAKASFHKTGVWPFDPSVVTNEMMAPSKETSCEGHLSVVPATPVQVITKLLQKLTTSDDHLEVREEDIDKGHGHSGHGALNGENDAEADGDGGEEVG